MKGKQTENPFCMAMFMSDKKTKGKSPNTEKLNYKRTFLIGLGFMGCMLLWSVYNSYVPVILRGKFTLLFDEGGLGQVLSSNKALSWITVPLLVNIVMTIDNIFGVIFQPYFGKKSDKTVSKFGKRMPYIIIGLPICAFFFCFIPVAAATKAVGLSIILMMAVIICFNFTMSVWRSPVVSLMPDFTPSHLQSDANAVINIMGGIGQVFGFIVGTAVSAIAGLLGFASIASSVSAKTDEATGRIVDELGNVTDAYPNYTSIFVVTAIISVLCLVALVAFYKKNSQYDLSAKIQAEEPTEQKQKKIKIKDLPISKDEKKSLMIMLASLFLISNATEAIIPNFTNFAQKTLQVEPIYSTLMMAVFAVSLAVFGIPAGSLGRKFGRKKTIIGGLVGIIIMFAIYLGISQFSTNQTLIWIILWIALVVGGACVGCVNINTLPLVLAIGGREFVGTFTGYYYTATFSAAVTGPILCGLVIGLFEEDYNFMFLFCAVMFLLGLLVITQVKHGEVSKDEDTSWIDEAVERADD